MAEPTSRWTCPCGRSNFSREYPCIECGSPPPANPGDWATVPPATETGTPPAPVVATPPVVPPPALEGEAGWPYQPAAVPDAAPQPDRQPDWVPPPRPLPPPPLSPPPLSPPPQTMGWAPVPPAWERPRRGPRRRPPPLAIGAVALAVIVAAVVLAVSQQHSAPAKPVPVATAEARMAATLLPSVPAGYDVLPASAPANGPVDAQAAAALETDPVATALALRQTGFQGGYIRTWTRQSSPGVIIAVGYQFAAASGAHSYFDTYVRAQRNRPGTTEFAVPGLKASNGFTDGSNASLVLQTVVLWKGARVYVVGIGDPAATATPAQAVALARTQQGAA